MKLEYKILWLDDNKKAIEEDSYSLEIEKHLREKAFIPEIILVDHKDEFFRNLDSVDFDLILTDFNLNDTDTGDKIIQQVRNRSIFTEIMFYSAQSEIKNTINLDRITFLDTSKTTNKNHYQDVIEKAISLIDLTIKKFENIVVMRGLIMQETSSLDTIIKSIVVKYLETLDDNNKQNLLEDILSSIERNATEKYNKVKSNKINDILRDNILFDSSQKIKALGKILTKLKLTDFSDDYTNDIISNRNKLAHAELIKNDQGKDCFKSKNNEIIFDEEFCKNIRKNLISYREKIENLQENDNFIRL
jgi:putative prophage encoded two-component system response regulator